MYYPTWMFCIIEPINNKLINNKYCTILIHSNQVRKNVIELRHEFDRHLTNARVGERLREGVHLAIVGEPNVGKSSLLNFLLQRPAAIVSSTAGTTRSCELSYYLAHIKCHICFSQKNETDRADRHTLLSSLN